MCHKNTLFRVAVARSTCINFPAGSSCMQFEAHDTPDRVGTKKNMHMNPEFHIFIIRGMLSINLDVFFFTPNLRNNGGNLNHNTSWSLNPGLKNCLIMFYWFVNFEWKCKAFFGANGLWNLRSKNRPFNPLARNEPRLNGSTVNEFYAKKKVLDLPISSVGIKWNVSQPCKPTSKIVCCNEILQTGLAQFLCLFPCIYVFQVWRQVMCIVLQTKWSELIEPTTTPSMAHWGKGRTWTLLHGKFAIWKSRSNCICAGPAGKWTDSHRSSLRWWSNWKPYGRHFLQTNYAPVRGEMFERQVGSCTRFETTSPPAIRRSNFDLICPRSGWDLKFTRSTIARFVIARKIPLPNYATDVGFFQVCSRTNGCKMQDICSESLRRNGQFWHFNILVFCRVLAKPRIWHNAQTTTSIMCCSCCHGSVFGKAFGVHVSTNLAPFFATATAEWLLTNCVPG